MVHVPLSTSLPLGAEAPDFSLVSYDGEWVNFADYEGWHGYMCMSLALDCRESQEILPELIERAKEVQQQGVAVFFFFQTSSGNIQATQTQLQKYVGEGNTLPLLLDEGGEIMALYGSREVPELWVFDANKQCVEYASLRKQERYEQGENVGALLHQALRMLQSGSTARTGQGRREHYREAY